MRGSVKLWKDERGFGFLSVDGGDDVFIHVSELPDHLDSLAIGDMVTFDPDTGKDGRKCAINVRVVD